MIGAGLLTIAAGVGTLLWQSGATVTSGGAAAQDADKAAAAAGFDTQDKAAIEAIVRASEAVARALENRPIRKVIVVPGRIVNVVV